MKVGACSVVSSHKKGEESGAAVRDKMKQAACS